MHIAVNSLASEDGGGYTYLVQLMRHMLLVDSHNRYVIFSQSRWDDADEFCATNRVQFVEVGPLSLPRRLAFEQLSLPAELRRRNVNLLYSPAEIASFRAPCSQVLGIQNPNPYQNPGIRWPIKEIIRLRFLRWGAYFSSRVVDHIVFVSRTSQTHILPVLRSPATSSTYVYHGIDLDRFQRPDNTTLLPSRTGILCVAAVERHKNLEDLIRGYTLLPLQIKKQHPLTIVGGHNDKHYLAWLKGLVSADGELERVTFKNKIPFREIPDHYYHARVFVLPSYLETFGLPLLEAMACGTPVVASNTSCLPEICGDAAAYYATGSPQELASVLLRVIEDESLTQNLIQEGYQRCKKFSWEHSAREMLYIFKAVAG